ncbi:hypothetical protein LUZ60_014043 [Juncus effusus]|nr:hypothetical protein LUZ60_014043 [Juncus effusus]
MGQNQNQKLQHKHKIYVLQLRKGDSFQCHKDSQHIMYYYDYAAGRPTKPPPARLRRLLFLLSSLSFSLLFLSLLFYSLGTEQVLQVERNLHQTIPKPPCSSMANNSVCCDRTALRADICFMRGDIRTHSPSSSILLQSSSISTNETEEKIRPYTRKWETNVMSTIDEIKLRHVSLSDSGTRKCDVTHHVPAVVFSTGGYTGNVYHEFNDGIIPLYITSQHFNRKVVFIILEYHSWWITKYGDVMRRLSKYKPIDFSKDKRTHCFKEIIVGLRIHDELTVDGAKMVGNKTIRDFRRMLDEAYKGRIRYIERVEQRLVPVRKFPVRVSNGAYRPKLVILSRRGGSRAIENEAELVELAKEIGFQVQVLRPDKTTELCKIYRALNYSDAMIGVHGAAMTHFLFMRPTKVFIQIVPLGTDWAADTYYGQPAVKLGLNYMPYKILPKESSLYKEYPKEDPVLNDPQKVSQRGWEVTKRVYLDRQNVNLDLKRFQKRLVKAHGYLVSKKMKN